MKKIKTIFVSCVAAIFFTSVTYSSSIAENITAELRPDINIIIDGHTQLFLDYENNNVYPIMYNGNTYISLRAMAEIMNKSIKWNSKTNTIYMDSNEANTSTSDIPSISPTDPSVTQSNIETDDPNIQEFHKAINVMFKEVESLQTVTDDNAILQQYEIYIEKVDDLKREIENYTNKLKYDLKSGSIRYDNYKERKNELTIVSNELLSVENLLEEKTMKNYNIIDKYD